MVEGTNFVEFPVQRQLTFLVVTGSLKLLLALKKTPEQGENGIGAWVGGSVVRTESARAGQMTRILISGGKNEVTELVKVDSTVLRAIVFVDNVINVLPCGAQELTVHKLVEFVRCKSPITVTVQLLEQLHRAEVRVPGKLLSS